MPTFLAASSTVRMFGSIVESRNSRSRSERRVGTFLTAFLVEVILDHLILLRTV